MFPSVELKCGQMWPPSHNRCVRCGDEGGKGFSCVIPAQGPARSVLGRVNASLHSIPQEHCKISIAIPMTQMSEVEAWRGQAWVHQGHTAGQLPSWSSTHIYQVTHSLPSPHSACTFSPHSIFPLFPSSPHPPSPSASCSLKEGRKSIPSG